MRAICRFVAGLFALLVAQGASADIRGNGGDLVTCRGADGIVTSTELLDYYEGRVSRAIVQDMPSNITDPLQLAEAVIERVARLDPRRAAYLLVHAREFMANADFVADVHLVDIPDSEHLIVPNGCAIEQFAIRRAQEFPGEKMFLVNQDLWNAASAVTRAGLILHEAIYGETIAVGQGNSIRARFYNSIISSNRIASMSHEDYRVILQNVGLVEADATSCSGIMIPGDYPTLRAALSANVDTGGLFCLPADWAEQIEWMDLGNARFEIAGMGQDFKTAGVLKLSCTGCSFVLRDLALSTFAFMNHGGDSNTKFQISRVTIAGVREFETFVDTFAGDVSIEQTKCLSDRLAIFLYGSPRIAIDRSLFNGGLLIVNETHLISSEGPTLRISNSVSKGALSLEYLDGFVVNNTITNGAHAGVYCIDGSLILKNNLITGNAIGFHNNRCSVVSKANAILENGSNYGGTAAPSPADYRGPLGLDTTANPVRPAAASPLIGFGDPEDAPQHDYFGQPRSSRIDVGAVQVSQ